MSRVKGWKPLRFDGAIDGVRTREFFAPAFGDLYVDYLIVVQWVAVLMIGLIFLVLGTELAPMRLAIYPDFNALGGFVEAEH